MAPETRILKAAAPVAPRRVEAAVFDADRRVRETVAAAAERARAVVAAAEAEREHILAAAREEGRREGEARAAATLLRAASERDRLLRESAPEVARLAVAVARKVLGRELADPGAAVGLAELALAEARPRREVVLRVHPADAPVVRDSGGRLARALGRAVEVREDPSVPPGGAVVDTEGGRIDAGIEAQLEVLSRALEEALRC
jgi:flagellar biosynthesis/type III secretory pathway protein FliH